MMLPVFSCASGGETDDHHDAQSGPPSRTSGHRHTILLSPVLIARVQARDHEAFRDLVEITYAPLVRFARSIVGSHEDAKDVVQDVFALVWNLGARWTPAGDPVAYLFASVRNHALKELRRSGRAMQRAQRLQNVETGLTGEPAYEDAGSPLDSLVETETTDNYVKQVSDVLATLTERQRTVYELRYRRGLTVPAIAEILGVTLKSAEHLTARVTRAVLERLRQGDLKDF